MITWHTGSALDVMRTMPDASVDLVVGSPPFWNLRDYNGTPGQWGSEPNPAAFLGNLLDLTVESRRILTPTGSLVFELGDSMCVDTDTEMLTQRGWLTWDQVAEGDQVMTLNTAIGLAEWQPILHMNVYGPKRRQMLHMSSPRGHSSLTTGNHRWWTQRRQAPGGSGQSRPGEANGMGTLTRAQADEIADRYRKGGVRQVDLAAEYGVTQPAISKIVRGQTWGKGDDVERADRGWHGEWCDSTEVVHDERRVPTAAFVSNLPVEQKWSDALVEAVAWYWTEGNDRRAYGKAKGAVICQSMRANPAHCERIRACLSKLFGPSTGLKLPHHNRWSAPGPAWSERPAPEEMARFHLNAAAAAVITQHTERGSKAVLTSWLCELTQAQLDLFVDVSVMADGHEKDDGEISLTQADPRRAEAFHVAATMAGRWATIKPYRDTWAAVYVGSKRNFKPIRTDSQWVDHDGVVWCPTTCNGTWLARRKGFPFFTGNSGSGGAGGDYNDGGMREGQSKFAGTAAKTRAARNTGEQMDVPLPKSLCGIPTLFAWSLAYGRNLLNPDHTIEPWRIRNLIAWTRNNPAVGALGDKFRPATSYITVACTSSDRWFDLEAVRGPSSPNTHALAPKGVKRLPKSGKAVEDGRGGSWSTLDELGVITGAPPLDHWWDDYDGDLAWLINTQGSRIRHWAMWPSKLAERLVLAMCPREVCTACGEPRRRITGDPEYVNDDGSTAGQLDEQWRHGRVGPVGDHLQMRGHMTRSAPTLGWSDCGCGAPFRAGIACDPFVGTGTTVWAAEIHGRDGIGIDLDPNNSVEAVRHQRRDEVRKNLLGVQPETPGQMSLLGALG